MGIICWRPLPQLIVVLLPLMVLLQVIAVVVVMFMLLVMVLLGIMFAVAVAFGGACHTGLGLAAETTLLLE